METGGSTRAAATTFTIAHQAPVSQTEFPINPGDPKAVQRYSSAPSLTPSTVDITTPAKPGAAPGDLFLAPYQGVGTPGPMIAEQNGELVWFHPLPAGESATNFEVQQYGGKPVLTWWQGRILEVGFGQGEDVIYNTSYKQVGVVHAGNGYHADLHEIRLTPEGTAWIDMFDPIDMNLSSYHGLSNGVITDSVVQEIDVKTGLVMWEWHALGHVPIGESHNPAPKSPYPWDYVHINSISPGPTGDVLLSSRSTWTMYDVDLHSGNVRWRLGGDNSSFKLGPGTRTYWQHDAEWQPGGLISVFDNGSDPPEEKQSRGLLLDPSLATHTVTLVKQFVNPTKTLLASSQGNTFSLPGGDWLMGYGGLPNFTEYDSSGHVLLDGTLGKNVQSFRTYLSPWSAQPTSAPSVAAAPGCCGSDRGLGELERGDRSGVLAGARGRIDRRARRGGHGREDGLSDDDRGARRRARTWRCRRSTPRARSSAPRRRSRISDPPARPLARARSVRRTDLADSGRGPRRTVARSVGAPGGRPAARLAATACPQR